MRQPEVRHVPDKIRFADIAAQTRIEAPLFGDARDGEAAIIVRGIEEAGWWQRQNLASHRSIHRARIALLKIGSPAAADQEAVAGERRAFIVENERHAALRVAGCRADLEITAAKLQAVAVLQVAVRTLCAAVRRNGDLAAAQRFQQPGTCHVIGMHVRVERRDELQLELVDQRRIASRLLEHRIDQHRGFAAPIGEQIRICRRLRIEELAEDQHRRTYSLAVVVANGAFARACERSASSNNSMPASIATRNSSALGSPAPDATMASSVATIDRSEKRESPHTP